MPYLPTSQAFLEQSSLLLSAYPDTTRITTKYSFSSHKREQKRLRRQARRTTLTQDRTTQFQEAEEGKDRQESQPQTQQPRVASITLKTFAPDAGICLKYRTDKAAEVGRLIAGLGLLAARKDVSSLGGVTAAAAVTTVASVDGSVNNTGDGDVKMGDVSVEGAVEELRAAGAPGGGASGRGGKSKKKGGGGKGKR